jgi:hypothetical protein
MPLSRFAIGSPNGFIRDEGGPPPNTPLKVGYRCRARPELTLSLDAWFLPPRMWREIARELKRKTADAADPERLSDAIAGIERFLDQRRLFGEGRSPWR